MHHASGPTPNENENTVDIQRNQPARTVAAATSAAAGLVHAGAAGSHAELRTLSIIFAIGAVAQLSWAFLVLVRPERLVAIAGIVGQTAMIGIWALSRTTGIGIVDGLEDRQSIGFSDGLAVALEATAVLAAVVIVSRLTLRGRGWLPAASAVALASVLVAVPAMAEPHDHTSGAHAAEVAAGDDHASEDHADEHDGEHDGEHDATPQDAAPLRADLVYPASFASWIEEADVSPSQRSAAEDLLVRSNEAVRARFPDEASLQAAGYVSIGDGATGWEHYIHVGHIADAKIIDPDAIESIVLRVNPDGTKDVASAMYLLPFGTTMDDVPDIAGDLTMWHDHQNLCWDGVRVVGTTNATGSCQRGEFRPTQPMMHVWIIDHPCGPFAGIEGSHGAGCAAHGHD